MQRENTSTGGKFSNTRQYVTQQQSCSSAFNCGQEYHALDLKLQLLAERVEDLEEDRKMKNLLLERTGSLIQIIRIILVLLPIVEIAVVGVVAYFLNNKSAIIYSLVGLIGLTTLINGFFLPKQIKDLEKRIEHVEKISE